MPEPEGSAGEAVEQRLRPQRIAHRERFQRARRLRSAMDFRRVRRGRSLTGSLLTLGYTRQPTPLEGTPPTPTRIGFSISRRVGKAVVRNVVKRRLRESIRRGLSRLTPGWDIVITARPSAASATYGELDAELSQLLMRAGLLAPEAREPREPIAGDAYTCGAPHRPESGPAADRGSIRGLV